MAVDEFHQLELSYDELAGLEPQKHALVVAQVAVQHLESPYGDLALLSGRQFYQDGEKLVNVFVEDGCGQRGPGFAKAEK